MDLRETIDNNLLKLSSSSIKSEVEQETHANDGKQLTISSTTVSSDASPPPYSPSSSLAGFQSKRNKPNKFIAAQTSKETPRSPPFRRKTRSQTNHSTSDHPTSYKSYLNDPPLTNHRRNTDSHNTLDMINHNNNKNAEKEYETEDEEEDEGGDISNYLSSRWVNHRLLKVHSKRKSGSMRITKHQKLMFENLRVAVIGAGISGISAAKRLTELGVSVIIYEARDRIGGRIHTVGCHAVSGLDLGASWIHGIHENPIYKICLKNNIRVYSEESIQTSALYDSNGEEFDKTTDSWALKTHQKHQEDAEKYGKNHPDSESIHFSLGPFLEAKMVEAAGGDKKKLNLLNWHLANIEYSSGADVKSLGLHTWDQDDLTALQGAHVMIYDGYQKIIEVLSSGLDIKLKHITKKIQYSDSGVSLYFEHSPNPVHFDFCILTVPLGVLKASLSNQFLKPNNIDHYSAPQTLNHTLAWHESLKPTPAFTTIHVPRKTVPPFALSEDHTQSDFSNFSLNTSTSTPFNPTGCIQFQPELPDWKQAAIRQVGFGLINKIALVFPHIFWDTSRRQLGWSSNIRGQYSQIVLLHPKPALLILMSGTFSFKSENREASELISEAMAVLTSIYGNLPPPLYASITRWNSDPFSRGSYSFLPPGMAGRDYDILSYPIKDRLLFAGEHTMRPYPSTVHGAYASGLREVDRIIDWMSGKLEKEKVQKWFFGPIGEWYLVDLNDIDCQPFYIEDILLGPSESERPGWFTSIRCGFCNQPQSIERPFVGCVLFGDINKVERKWAVHEDCSYFSPEVGSNNEGSRWYNISRALMRSASTSCVICHNPGATIGCSVKDCKYVCHLPCAKKHLDWPQFDDPNHIRPLLCPTHKYAQLTTANDSRSPSTFLSSFLQLRNFILNAKTCLDACQSQLINMNNSINTQYTSESSHGNKHIDSTRSGQNLINIQPNIRNAQNDDGTIKFGNHNMMNSLRQLIIKQKSLS